MVGRIAIRDVAPTVSCGEHPARAVTSEVITVRATVFREGHDAVGCDAVVARPDGSSVGFLRMAPGPDDGWSVPVTVDVEGLWSFHVEAWSDPLGTWWHDAPLKVDAAVDVEVVMEEGAQLHERVLGGLPTAHRAAVRPVPALLRDSTRDPQERLAAAMALQPLLQSFPLRELVTAAAPRQVWVDRRRALFGSWYELFPRSEGATLDPPMLVLQRDGASIASLRFSGNAFVLESSIDGASRTWRAELPAPAAERLRASLPRLPP